MIDQRGRRDPELAPGWDHPAARLVPYVFAVVTGFQILKYFVVQPKGIGFDARLYMDASRAWLEGGDPWAVSSLGIYYGAPPPTLLVFAPLTFLPEVVAMWLVILGSFALAAAAFRSIGMPLWWLVAWPIVDGTLVGNPDVALLAVLVLARGRLSWLAPFLKIYGVLPLIGERRWTALAIAAAGLLITAVVLPWASWWAQLPTISQRLAGVSDTSSAYGSPILMGIAAVSLAALGLRRATWLAVPALWPYTQPHYLVMSLPAMSPLLAIAWASWNPVLIVGSLAIEAVARLKYRGLTPQPMGATT